MILSIVALFSTVLTGTTVLALWLDPLRTQTDRRSTVLGFIHVTTALAAVSFWLVFVIAQSRTTAWISGSLLAATVALGLSTVISSRAREHPATDDTPEPVAKVALAAHAAAAAIAVVLCAVAFISR